MNDNNKQRSGPRNQQTARAGEYFVAAELNRQGAYAVTFAGNMPKIDILASSQDRSRTVWIQVKTRRKGNWQTSSDQGQPCQYNPGHTIIISSPKEFPCQYHSVETCFWVFVDLREELPHPNYYLTPECWIRHNIHKVHQEYLAKHGGKPARNPNSDHHMIVLDRIKDWGEWRILKLF